MAVKITTGRLKDVVVERICYEPGCTWGAPYRCRHCQARSCWRHRDHADVLCDAPDRLERGLPCESEQLPIRYRNDARSAPTASLEPATTPAVPTGGLWRNERGEGLRIWRSKAAWHFPCAGAASDAPVKRGSGGDTAMERAAERQRGHCWASAGTTIYSFYDECPRSATYAAANVWHLDAAWRCAAHFDQELWTAHDWQRVTAPPLSAPRDSQRQRVYDAERAVSGMLMAQIRDRSLADLYVDRVWACLPLPASLKPRIVWKDIDRARVAGIADIDERVIELRSTFGSRALIILHEIAHFVTYQYELSQWRRVADHGPEFCGLLLQTVAACFGLTARDTVETVFRVRKVQIDANVRLTPSVLRPV